MNVYGSLLPDPGPQDGAVSKANRAPCPQGAPILASITHCLFSAAMRHPLLTWSWGSISPGSHSRGLWVQRPSFSFHASPRKTDARSALYTVLARGTLAGLRLLPTALEPRAPLLPPRQCPGNACTGAIRHI